MTSPGPLGPPLSTRERWACRLRATLAGHAGPVLALAWGQLGDRRVLASSGGDGTIRLWDPEQGQQLRTLVSHPGGGTSLAWGQLGGVHALAWRQLGDRPVLASGGPGPVKLWDPEQGQQLGTLTGHPAGVLALAWGQLGDRPVLASGSGGDDGRRALCGDRCGKPRVG
jgi:hypothetical protein